MVQKVMPHMEGSGVPWVHAAKVVCEASPTWMRGLLQPNTESRAANMPSHSASEGVPL